MSNKAEALGKTKIIWPQKSPTEVEVFPDMINLREDISCSKKNCDSTALNFRRVKIQRAMTDPSDSKPFFIHDECLSCDIPDCENISTGPSSRSIYFSCNNKIICKACFEKEKEKGCSEVNCGSKSYLDFIDRPAKKTRERAEIINQSKFMEKIFVKENDQFVYRQHRVCNRHERKSQSISMTKQQPITVNAISSLNYSSGFHVQRRDYGREDSPVLIFDTLSSSAESIVNKSKNDEALIQRCRQNGFTDDSCYGLSKRHNELQLIVDHNDLCSLNGKSLVNTEAINYYLGLIMLEKRKTEPNYLYCFDHHFIQQLQKKRTDEALKRFERVKILKYNRLLIPIVKNIHWTLACVDLKRLHEYAYESKISILDSLGSTSSPDLDLIGKLIKLYLQQKNGHIKIEQRRFQHVPRQNNGYDCGVFVCMFAKCLAKLNRNEEDQFNFQQADMRRFRKQIQDTIIQEKFEY